MNATNNAAQARQYHILKTDPEVFQAVLLGAKTFEIRLNDRGYAVGDVLGLRETKHTGAEMQAGAPLEYTGRECQRFVSHVLTGYGLADGWCCLSFDLPNAGGASAPVAGEAQPVAWFIDWPADPELGHYLAESPADNGRSRPLVFADAAPQASEAVRILFPAHLRKMWSGGEVQAWLDQHQGVTPAKPSAKGSLERYRKWQAERDEAFGAGVKAAADLVKKMVNDYDTDHGSTDPETGTREYPGEGATWLCEMEELEESIRALKSQPQADKDGCLHPRAFRSGDKQGYVCQDCGAFESDYEIHRRQQRAALSATQTEQGERD